MVANVSYNTLFSLCDYYLSLNRNVIIDTPCYYLETLDNGINLAKKYNAKYKYIECRVDNFEEVNRRLKSRERKLSQWTSTKEDVYYMYLNKSKYPKNIKYIKRKVRIIVIPYFNIIMKFYIVISILLCVLIVIIYKKRENKLNEIRDSLKRIEDKIN